MLQQSSSIADLTRLVLLEVRWSTYDDTQLLQLGYEGVSSAAVALSSAPRSLTAGGAVAFEDATNPAHAPARANARLVQSICLYLKGLTSPALSSAVPSCRNHSHSSRPPGFWKLMLVHVSESLSLCARSIFDRRLADLGTWISSRAACAHVGRGQQPFGGFRHIDLFHIGHSLGSLAAQTRTCIWWRPSRIERSRLGITVALLCPIELIFFAR